MLLGIDRLRVFDIDKKAVDKLTRNLSTFGVMITRCESVQDALIGADIVTTITADKKNAVILSDNMVGAGVHINAVGGDCPGKTELAPAILSRSSIFVEYAPQTRIEGEIQQLAADHPGRRASASRLWREACRVSRDEITVFDSVGFAIEDFSVLRLLRELSLETGIGEEIDLFAAPDDPKDMFRFCFLRRKPEAADASPEKNPERKPTMDALRQPRTTAARDSILMCASRSFRRGLRHQSVDGKARSDASIKPWRAGSGRICVNASRQWLISNSFRPQAGAPDMVFTANAGLAIGGVAVVSRFHTAERQPEEPLFRAWFERNGLRDRAVAAGSGCSRRRGRRAVRCSAVS